MYHLAAGNALSLDGAEYVAAADVTTTSILSCFLVIGRCASAGAAAVIHVVHWDKQGNEFDQEGVYEVQDKMIGMDPTGRYAVVGGLDAWRGEFAAPYRNLLGDLGVVAGVPTTEGVHRVQFVEPGTIRVTDGGGTTYDFAL